MTASSKRYFVVHTQPNSEAAVKLRLRRFGHHVYLPRIKVQVRHAGREDWVYRPFLPRYMFVEDDGSGISDIKRTYGVCGVIRAGLEPVRVSQAVVDKIVEREVDGFVKLDHERFSPGQQLLLTDHKLLNVQNVTFYKMKDSHRALVFIKALIGRVMTEVPAASLQEA